MPVVLAVDQSISHSGLCLRTSVEDAGRAGYTASAIRTSAGDWRGQDFQRKLYVVSQIRKVIEDSNPDLFVMEEYARQARNSSSLIPLVELGALIKRVVFIKKIPLLVISNSGLKKFAAGTGHCGKAIILKEVLKRWHFDTNDDNEADAFVLALMGFYYAQAIKEPDSCKFIKEHPVLTEPQRESLLTLLKKKEE